MCISCSLCDVLLLACSACCTQLQQLHAAAAAAVTVIDVPPLFVCLLLSLSSMMCMIGCWHDGSRLLLLQAVAMVEHELQPFCHKQCCSFDVMHPGFSVHVWNVAYLV
jgi:hypothetical protein